MEKSQKSSSRLSPPGLFRLSARRASASCSGAWSQMWWESIEISWRSLSSGLKKNLWWFGGNCACFELLALSNWSTRQSVSRISWLSFFGHSQWKAIDQQDSFDLVQMRQLLFQLLLHLCRLWNSLLQVSENSAWPMVDGWWYERPTCKAWLEFDVVWWWLMR